MATRCDQCREPATRTTSTVTGRELCDRCQDRLLGLTAGVIAGDGDGDVGTAIATAGWFSRLRERRRR